MKKEFSDNREYLNKKLAYPYENFNCIDEYSQKPVNDLKKEGFFSKIKKNSTDEKIERTKKLINYSILKMENN